MLSAKWRPFWTGDELKKVDVDRSSIAKVICWWLITIGLDNDMVQFV